MNFRSKFRLHKNNGSNNKLLFYAFVIGVLVGIVSSFFRICLNFIEQYRDKLFSISTTEASISWIYPIIFIAITVSLSLFLVRKYAPETTGSGIQEIEGALDGIRRMRWKRVLPVKFFASLLS